jgi:hypothetical protein
MNDDNMLEEKCSCGASCKLVLHTAIGAISEAKDLLNRFDDWRARHVHCVPSAGVARPIRPPAPNPPPPKCDE